MIPVLTTLSFLISLLFLICFRNKKIFKKKYLEDNTYYQFNVPVDLPYLWADTETQTTKWGTKPNETKQKVNKKT